MGSLKRVVIEDMAGIKNDKLYKDWLDHLRTNTSMEEAGIFYKDQKDVSTIDYYNNKNYPEVINSAKAMVEDNNHLVWV